MSVTNENSPTNASAKTTAKASVARLISTQAISEGAGVKVRRSIGTPALRNLDPFLMLDYFGSDDPDQYIAGFPNHPHRGFVTFTYMLDGHMLHEDSMGNSGDLKPGAVQWMKAASGVIHSEMPQQESGLMRGFQLWINLPASEKMSDPEYQEFQAEMIPVVELEGAQVKVLIGDFAGTSAPVRDLHTATRYLDVQLDANAQFSAEMDAESAAFAFLYAGEVTIGGTRVSGKTLIQLSHGDSLELTAGDEAAQFILVSGRPIGEPIAQYGPFVMNNEHEIQKAFADYQSGQLVRNKASVNAE